MEKKTTKESEVETKKFLEGFYNDVLMYEDCRDFPETEPEQMKYLNRFLVRYAKKVKAEKTVIGGLSENFYTVLLTSLFVKQAFQNGRAILNPPDKGTAMYGFGLHPQENEKLKKILSRDKKTRDLIVEREQAQQYVPIGYG